MHRPAWTYSGLDTFATCPKKYYHLKVVKDVVDPPNEHTEWGQRVHDAMERRLRDNDNLPEGMTHWEPLARKLQALPGQKLTEQKFAVDHDFQPADWSAAWSRGIADLVIIHKDTAVIADYKTGKRKPSEQLELYALYVFSHYPTISKIIAAFVWLKERAFDKQLITRGDEAALRELFRDRAKRLELAHEHDRWPARPSGLCRAWCPVTTCEFNGKRK